MSTFSVYKLNAFAFSVRKTVLFDTGRIHGAAFLYKNIR